ncbi:hypothetical protein ACJX0J_026247 [Zea mays]
MFLESYSCDNCILQRQIYSESLHRKNVYLAYNQYIYKLLYFLKYHKYVCYIEFMSRMMIHKTCQTLIEMYYSVWQTILLRIRMREISEHVPFLILKDVHFIWPLETMSNCVF